MRFCVFILCVLSGIYYCLGQTNQAPPSKQPTRPSSTTQRQEVINTAGNVDGRFNDLHNLSVPQNNQRPASEVVIQDIQPLYRRPGKKEFKELTPSESNLAKYEQFLKQSNTGIFKLNADYSCARNTVVVAATQNCLENTIPGAGTAYSFRVNSYRILHLADLILEKNVLKTDGVMQQGVMVDLGNIDLENISTETKGLKFLLDFKPAANKEELQKVDQDLSAGIKADGFVYRLGFYANTDTTFALRSIAYRGKMMRSVKGVSYNEMDYDKRKDVLIVFRIVEKEPNGNITIIWKEIAKKDSPILNNQ